MHRRLGVMVLVAGIALGACRGSSVVIGEDGGVEPTDARDTGANTDAAGPIIECTEIPDGGSHIEGTLRAVAMGRAADPDRAVVIGFLLVDPPFDFTRLQTATGADRDAIIAERVAQLAPSQDAVSARIVARGGVVQGRLWGVNVVYASMPARFLVEAPCYPFVQALDVETNWYDVVPRPWDVATVGTRACPLTMSVCPPHCRTIAGLAIDRSGVCTRSEWLPIGCSVDEQSIGWGDLRCNAISGSGALYIAMDESLAAPDYAGWRACDATERDLVTRATSPCP